MKLRKILSAILVLSMLLSAAVIGMTANAAEELPFTDVPDTWYTDAVASVYSEGIMKGKTETTFDPMAKITRAEVVTAFARVACTNIDTYGKDLPFTDTFEGQWYSDSVGWAAACGIVAGRGGGIFSPADNITRAELASILTKFIAYMGVELPDNSKIDKFADADTFDSWMVSPIEEVRKNGLMQGSDGKFNPRGNATRAEIATVIMNLLPDAGRVAVVEDGKSDYVIVIDEGNAAAVDAAERMAWQIEETCGVTVKVADDSAKATAKEIVLGKTSRGAKIDTSSMIRDEYEIKVDGAKIYIDAASADGLYGGAVSFLLTATSGDDVRFTAKTAEVTKFEYPVGKITIAGNDISKYTVYYPTDADEFVKSAANDISYYIEEACGVKLPVEAGTPEGLYIAIETVPSDKEFDDSFTVKIENGCITISGHANRGAVYGAYDFLEQFVGVRYITNDTDYIKPAEEINITDANYNENPLITYRILHHWNYRDAVPSGISVKNKSIRDVKWAGNFCHTFDALDGDYSSQYVNQPCLTSDDVFELMLANARKTLQEYPDAEIISISHNDNENFCKCENCLASYEKYGGKISGTMIEFVNKMSDELVKDYPNIKIHTFAYQGTIEPPEGIVARDNIVVQFCPIYNCYNHPFTNTCPANKSFSERVEKWSKIAKEIQIWDYSYQWDLDGTPYPTMGYNEVASNYRLFVENNVSYVFNNNDYQLNNGEFIALHAYLLTKVMWDPYITEEEYYGYMQDFLAGFYGEGWESIYKAIMTVEDNYTRCVMVDYTTPAENMMHMYMRSYIDDVISMMTDGRLKTDTALKFANADVAMTQYEWVKLDLVFNQLYESEDPADNEKAQKMCRDLYNKFSKYGLKFVDSLPHLDISEIEEFDRIPSKWSLLIGEIYDAKERQGK
ncbi:MAG: DUF4838 domain-containing protein [Clostridia bacterium]|nr:DUF4838 domain-containing protein [Clostridia bacterium]